MFKSMDSRKQTALKLLDDFSFRSFDKRTAEGTDEEELTFPRPVETRYRRREQDFRREEAKIRFSLMKNSNANFKLRLARRESRLRQLEASDQASGCGTAQYDSLLAASTQCDQINERAYLSDLSALKTDSPESAEKEVSAENRNLEQENYLTGFKEALQRRKSRTVTKLEYLEQVSIICDRTKGKFLESLSLVQRQNMLHFKTGAGTEMAIKDSIENRTLLTLAEQVDISEFLKSVKEKQFLNHLKRAHLAKKRLQSQQVDHKLEQQHDDEVKKLLVEIKEEKAFEDNYGSLSNEETKVNLESLLREESEEDFEDFINSKKNAIEANSKTLEISLSKRGKIQQIRTNKMPVRGLMDTNISGFLNTGDPSLMQTTALDVQLQAKSTGLQNQQAFSRRTPIIRAAAVKTPALARKETSPDKKRSIVQEYEKYRSRFEGTYVHAEASRPEAMVANASYYLNRINYPHLKRPLKSLQPLSGTNSADSTHPLGHPLNRANGYFQEMVNKERRGNMLRRQQQSTPFKFGEFISNRLS